MGAYIIMTRYLGLKREKVARSLLETLTLESPAFYESIPKTVAERAILSASELNLSSWDTYLVELAKALEISRIYSVDEELARKVKDLDVMNPIPDSVMDKYHRFLERRIS
jgi:predicted nucleic acid-binding protein